MATTWYPGVEELLRLRRDLGELRREAKPHVRRAMQKACADIKATAVVLAPVDTGDLRKSITYETRESATGITGIIGPSMFYGIFQEYGTSRHAPQPYMTPAFDRHAPAFEAAIADIASRFPTT